MGDRVQEGQVTKGEKRRGQCFFFSWPLTRKKRGRESVVHATVPAKKRRKVWTEMNGGWEGHLLHVQPCHETLRKSTSFGCKN